MQFPVSSGTHHRANESEWVPVEPSKSAKKDKEPPEPTNTDTTVATKPKVSAATSTASKPPDDVPLPTTGKFICTLTRENGIGIIPFIDFIIRIDYGYSTSMFTQEPELPRPSFAAPVVPPPLPASASAQTTVPSGQQTSDNIFADKVAIKDLDVTSIITKRLNAMRKLQENPMDSEAIKLMYRTQKDVCITPNISSNCLIDRTISNLPFSSFQMSAWASSKFVPGQFTGSTGANILSTKELASGFQAWAKRVSFIVSCFILSIPYLLKDCLRKWNHLEMNSQPQHSLMHYEH